MDLICHRCHGIIPNLSRPLYLYKPTGQLFFCEFCSADFQICTKCLNKSVNNNIDKKICYNCNNSQKNYICKSCFQEFDPGLFNFDLICDACQEYKKYQIGLVCPSCGQSGIKSEITRSDNQENITYICQFCFYSKSGKIYTNQQNNN